MEGSEQASIVLRINFMSCIDMFWSSVCVYHVLTSDCATRTALRFLRIALGLAQSTLADIHVHSSVLVKNGLVHGTSKGSESPVHDTMGPVWGASRGNTLRTTTAADLAESGANELLGVGHEQRCLADLAHGAGDEVGLHKLDLDTLRLELRAKSSRPLLQERLAAAVCRKVGSWQDAAEGCHGQDQTALALDHAGCDELSDAKSAHTVDCNDVAHLLR
jgi:hypothetical protein